MPPVPLMIRVSPSPRDHTIAMRCTCATLATIPALFSVTIHYCMLSDVIKCHHPATNPGEASAHPIDPAAIMKRIDPAAIDKRAGMDGLEDHTRTRARGRNLFVSGRRCHPPPTLCAQCAMLVALKPPLLKKSPFSCQHFLIDYVGLS